MEEEKKVHQGRFLKAKKFLVSKVAKTGMGQNTILHYLGPQGSTLMAVLQSATTKHVGEAKSKQIIENVYVLACKAALLYKDGFITDNDQKKMAHPVNSLAIAIYQGVVESRNNPPSVNVDGLVSKLHNMEELVCGLLKPHIKEKNLQKAHTVFEQVGRSEFLTLLLTDISYREYRRTLGKEIRTILLSRLDGEELQLIAPPRSCRTVGCGLEALEEDGEFAGSHYCESHHRIQYDALSHSPYLNHFIMENGFDYKPFLAIAHEFFPPNSSLMMRGICNYKEASPRIMRVFAEGITEKYLSPTSKFPVTCLSPEVMSALPARCLVADVACFDPALSELKAAMTKVFEERFLPSEHFKEYLRTRKPI